MVFDTRYSIYARLVDKTKRHEECSLITITLKLSSKKLSTFLIRSYKDSPLLRKIKAVTMNFGPNHPAAHGILKLIMQFQGEILQRLDPQFGFLHRGTEKLSEYRNYLQILPYFDRFDYVANLFQEHAFCLAAEELNSYSKPVTFEFCLTQIRTLFDELSRLLNHLLTMSATCLDLGSMGPIFWAFEERERLMEFYERASGARMHTALYKPFSFDWTVINSSFLLELSRFLLRAGRSISGAVMGLINNKVLKSRLGTVGMLSLQKITSYGLTGIISRSGGLRKDLRLRRSTKYGSYWTYSFRTFLGRRGDNLDRFLLRIKESFEIFKLTSQILAYLFNFFWTKHYHAISLGYLPQIQTLSVEENFFSALNVKTKFSGMEELITHFKQFSDGANYGSGAAYYGVEGPKGEVGVMLISAGYSKPYRVKVRTPVSHNMHILPSTCVGFVFGDFVMTFCSLDIVLGEIDR